MSASCEIQCSVNLQHSDTYSLYFYTLSIPVVMSPEVAEVHNCAFMSKVIVVVFLLAELRTERQSKLDTLLSKT